MNSAEEEMEAAFFAALRRHQVEYPNLLMGDLIDIATAYAAADSDALTAARRRVLDEATASGPGHTSPSTAPGGRTAHPRELDPSGSRAGRPEEATLSTGRFIPSQVRDGRPQPVDNRPVETVEGR